MSARGPSLPRTRTSRRSTTAALVLAGLGQACSRPPPPPPPERPPEVVMEDVRLRHTRGDRTLVDATAPHVELARSSSGLTAADASVRLVERGVTITAARVEGELGAGHLVGSGGVVLHAPDGTTGTSPTVTVERSEGAEGRAHSDAGVQVRGDGVRLDARGFVVDFAEQRAVFDQPVTTVEKAR